MWTRGPGWVMSNDTHSLRASLASYTYLSLSLQNQCGRQTHKHDCNLSSSVGRWEVETGKPLTSFPVLFSVAKQTQGISNNIESEDEYTRLSVELHKCVWHVHTCIYTHECTRVVRAHTHTGNAQIRHSRIGIYVIPYKLFRCIRSCVLNLNHSLCFQTYKLHRQRESQGTYTHFPFLACPWLQCNYRAGGWGEAGVKTYRWDPWNNL